MPTYKNKQDIRAAIERLNERLLNRAFSFKVYSKDSYCLYIQASFDFGYYVNLHIECLDVVYTNLNEKQEWPDAWNDDQVFIMNENELDQILSLNEIEVENKNNIIGFIFNLSCKENYLHHGSVICKSIDIRWENPKYID
jgi:hypothetical protein